MRKDSDAQAGRVNLKPSFWGNYVWSFLFIVALGYPSNASATERVSMVNTLRSLEDLLPCKTCRTNYKKEIENNPPEPHVGSSAELLQYINDLRNTVARRLGKPERLLSDVLQTLYAGRTVVVGLDPVRRHKSEYCLHLIWILLLTIGVTIVLTSVIMRSIAKHKLASNGTSFKISNYQ